MHGNVNRIPQNGYRNWYTLQRIVPNSWLVWITETARVSDTEPSATLCPALQDSAEINCSAGLIPDSTGIQGPGSSQQELPRRMPLLKLWNQCENVLWHRPACLSLAAAQTWSANRAKAETSVLWEKGMKEPWASSLFSVIFLALADFLTWATFTFLYINRAP